MGTQSGSNLFSQLSENPGVAVALTDENGLAMFVGGVNLGGPPAEVGIYQHGCILVRTDGKVGSTGLYENVGSPAVPNWVAVGTSAPGSITLTDGHILVGDAGNNASDVAVSGDVHINNTGVTTIQPASIDKVMLSAGISASYMVIAAGSFTTVGGGVNETIPVVGALNTDIAFVVLQTAGAAPVAVLTSIAASGQIKVTMSADPSNDHVLSYQLLRATS